MNSKSRHSKPQNRPITIIVLTLISLLRRTSRFAITGTSKLSYRVSDANQKVVFPNASRALADARRGRFLHSARCARFGRNDNGALPPFGRNEKKRPAFSPSIHASQATKMTPPHCHFEHGTQPVSLSFRPERSPPLCHFDRRRAAPEWRNLMPRAPTRSLRSCALRHLRSR